MDYTKELNALYHFMLRKKMPKSETALLSALYMISSAGDGASWFCADNELLGRLTGGYSRESINAARNGLKQKGRIDFRPGNRNEGSARYRIIPFCGGDAASGADAWRGEPDMEPDKELDIKPDMNPDMKPDTGAGRVKSDMKPDMKLDIKPDMEPDMNPDTGAGCGKSDMKPDIKPDIKPDSGTKQEQNRDKGININSNINNNIFNTHTPYIHTSVPQAGHFEEFMAAYPDSRRRGPAAKAYCDLILTGLVSEEELLEAARNYAESCRITGAEGRYVKYASNFLQEGVFEDYLPGKYTAPSRRRKTDASKGMLRTDYGDLSALEEELLSNAVPGADKR